MHHRKIPECLLSKQKNIKYLVFGGGGAAGCAYGGVLYELGKEPSFSFDNLEAVAGTSIGSITALMVALRYTPEEGMQLFQKLDLKGLADKTNAIEDALRLIYNYGIYKGEALKEFIKEIIKGKISDVVNPEDVTFEYLRQHGFLDLYVYSCKAVNNHELIAMEKGKLFCVEKTPLTSVLTAVRASAAPPTVFQCIRLKKLEHGKYIEDKNGDPYVDGGLLNNYPIEIFDDEDFILSKDDKNRKFNSNTLGIAFKLDSNEQSNKNVKVQFIVNQVSAWIHGMSDEMQRRQTKIENTLNANRTILVDRQNVKLDDFFITKDKIDKLFNSGKQAVKDYFSELNNKHARMKHSDGLFDKGRKTTALFDAVDKSDFEDMEKLLQNGANINGVRGKDNSTPLHRAIINSDLKMVTYLLQHGADKKAKLTNGKTALQLAKELGNKDIITYLECFKKRLEEDFEFSQNNRVTIQGFCMEANGTFLEKMLAPVLPLSFKIKTALNQSYDKQICSINDEKKFFLRGLLITLKTNEKSFCMFLSRGDNKIYSLNESDLIGKTSMLKLPFRKISLSSLDVKKMMNTADNYFKKSGNLVEKEVIIDILKDGGFFDHILEPQAANLSTFNKQNFFESQLYQLAEEAEGIEKILYPEEIQKLAVNEREPSVCAKHINSYDKMAENFLNVVLKKNNP